MFFFVLLCYLIEFLEVLIIFLFNTLTLLDWSKLKAFADDKLNVTEKMKFVLEGVENIVGKGDIAHHEQFLLFPQCFQKSSVSGSWKDGIVW